MPNPETLECEIAEIRVENPNVRTYSLSKRFADARPGQFAMVGLEDGGEIPLSFSNRTTLTVRKIASEEGKPKTSTERIWELEKGDMLIVRGPLGNGFNLHDADITAIAGGIGAAPLSFAIREYGEKRRTKTYGGWRTKDDMLLMKDFETFSDFSIATDDGSAGHHGTVVDLLKERGEEIRRKKYIICGPERMMDATARYLTGIGVNPEDIQISLERYMKCGSGLCATCSCDGYRVCVDGPVFTYKQLLGNRHFGKLKRAPSGKLVPI